MGVGNVTKKTVRAAKSVTKGYTNTQSKVRNATKNDPSLPTTRELNEIADLSYNSVDFIEIMEVISKRLNDKGKAWRHVFKALTVLEYLLFWGSDNVIRYCEDNLYEIKTLREFQYIDDNATDCGMNVRQKAKDITNLVLNPNMLKSKRRKGPRPTAQVNDELYGSHNSSPYGRDRARNTPDDDTRRAMAESRRQAEQKRKNSEEEDLQRAMRLSKEEEERRKRAVESSNGALFNDLEEQKAKKDLIDLSDIQITPSPALQVQYTAYVQPQYTAVQPQYTQLQPQYTQFQAPLTYDQNSAALQAEYLRQQAEWAQQQQLQAQQEEYLRQQSYLAYQQQQLQQQYTQPLQPQTTSIGSNNPFAAPSPSPSLSSTSTTSSVSRTTSPATPYSARSLSRQDDRHAHLAGLFAARVDDGVDTFGNQGFLRYGPTDTGRIAATKTGNSSVYLSAQHTAVY
ncbi:ENTH-domain-containing protein [Phanerochaete sordida]|uniref:ENTH-domain-containing protein n=1 Tax=Phanerochaete sordida TaxID=48140 RepID=A0A9P3GCV5_9APHY|nr:ENTH-domain-containing protein [Phanerochaete sordida]